MKIQQTIKRKDGIEYTRERNSNEYSTHLHIRIDANTLNQIKEIAKEKEINYSDLIRKIIKEYIEKGE